MKKIKKILAVCLGMSLLIVCFAARWINRVNEYNEAVESLSCGDYETALTLLDSLGEYRESRCLKNYAMALYYADSGSQSATLMARTYISRISDQYEGTLGEEIRLFKASVASGNFLRG